MDGVLAAAPGGQRDLLAGVPRWALCLLLVAASVGLYARSLQASFVSDDFLLIFEPTWQATPATSDHFRPLAILFLKGFLRLVGPEPVPYHLVLVGLHVLSVFLVFRFTYALGGRKDIAGLTAVLYAVYLRHHEPVVWLAAGGNVLPAAVFGLLTLVTFQRGQCRSNYSDRNRFSNMRLAPYISRISRNKLERHQDRASRSWRALSYGSFALALLSSEWAIVTAGLLAALLWWRPTFGEDEEGGWGTPSAEMARTILPYAAIAAAYLPLQFAGAGFGKLTTTGAGYHFVGFKPALLAQWARFFVYGWLPFLRLGTIGKDAIATALLGGAIIASLVALARGSATTKFWIVWIWMASAPFAAFGIFGPAERHFYLLAVGPSALTAWAVVRGLAALAKRWRGAALAAGVVVGLGVAAAAVGIQGRIQAWVEAGRTVQHILAEIRALHPALPSDSEILAVGFPRDNGTASILHQGLGAALRRAYGQPTLRVWYTFDSSIGDVLERTPPGAPEPKRYVLLYRGGHVRDMSSRYHELKARLDPARWTLS
ncbi:MAG: hypothetical protein HY724_03635 [Candidatus Rokubacteria bacterium]|nr:hypothetical protein [Candidatus Rokubacteria bacterium]